MIVIVALPSRAIELGRLGENEHRQVSFDVSEYLTMYPSASFTLLHKLPGASVAYPVVSTSVQDGKLLWTVTNADLAAQGLGQCELLVMEGEVIAKSIIYQTQILPALDGSGTVPDPWESWQEVFAGLKDDAEQAAEDAEAASQAVQDMGVSSTTLAAGSSATVEKSVDAQTGAVTLTFGLPKGDKGDTGSTGETGPAGQDGADGADGVSPTVSVSEITGGHRVSITDAEGTSTFDVMDGEQGETGPAGADGKDGKDGQDGAPGQDGQDGADGYSPTASVTKSGSTATITITDKSGTTTATVSDGTNGQDGAPGVGVPSGGTDGQMLVKDGATDYATKWANQPTVPVTDVQVNGTSVVSQGVANVPIGDSSNFGVFKTEASFGITVNNAGKLYINIANANEMKAGSQGYKPIVPANQHTAAFYGLAKAAGDTTQGTSANSVGTYTEDAKVAIQKMLGVYDAPFRLVKTIEITEAITKAYVNSDTNGDPFALKEVIIHFDGLTASGGGNCGISVNSGQTYTGSTIPYLGVPNLASTTAQYRVANLSVRGGKFFGEAFNSSLGNTYNSTQNVTSLNASGIIDSDLITEICIGSLNSYSLTGGTIKVYGR